MTATPVSALSIVIAMILLAVGSEGFMMTPEDATLIHRRRDRMCTALLCLLLRPW